MGGRHVRDREIGAGLALPALCICRRQPDGVCHRRIEGIRIKLELGGGSVLCRLLERHVRRLVIDGQNLTSQFVALRFIEMLRRTAGGADTFLLEESTKTLEYLNRLLTGGTGGAQPPDQLTQATK